MPDPVPAFPDRSDGLSKEENYLVTKQQLETRLIYGSYPEVLKNETAEAKTDYLKELVSAYLLKDILMFEQARYPHKMLQLLQLVAYQTGHEVSRTFQNIATRPEHCGTAP